MSCTLLTIPLEEGRSNLQVIKTLSRKWQTLAGGATSWQQKGKNAWMYDSVVDFQRMAGCWINQSYNLMCHTGFGGFLLTQVSSFAYGELFSFSLLTLSQTPRVWLIISLVVWNAKSNWLSEKENKLRHGSVKCNGFVVFFGIGMFLQYLPYFSCWMRNGL